MAKDSYWFRHDSTAGRGLKMRKIAHIYGHWGKGVYWDVVEMLRDSEKYEYDNSEFDLTMLADLIGCKDQEKFLNWYSDCIKFGLLEEKNGKFYSPALKEVMGVWETKKNNGSKGGRPSKKTENKPKKNLNETKNKPKHKANGNHNIIEQNIIEYNRIEDNINKQNYKPEFDSIFSKIKTRFYQDWITEVYNDYKSFSPTCEKSIQEFIDGTMKYSILEFCKSCKYASIKFFNETAAINYWKQASKGYVSDVDVWRDKLKAMKKRSEEQLASLNS